MPYFASPADGTRLHYVDHGPADGPVAVFVNSAYLATDMWEFQLLPLAEDGVRCVGLDRRGHGRSDDVWGGYDLDTLADDLQGLLDHLGLREVTLIGHSVGSAEIVRCLTRHGGERVARVALVAGITPGLVRCENNPDGWDPEVMSAATDDFLRDRAAFFNDPQATGDFFALHLPGNDVSPAYVRHVSASCMVATARASSAVQRMIAGLDVSDELAKIERPVLVVHGTHDVSAPLETTGRRAAALAPDSTLKVYDGAAHGLFVTHAERLTADLREFVRGDGRA